jgi:hypothetical protein
MTIFDKLKGAALTLGFTLLTVGVGHAADKITLARFE